MQLLNVNRKIESTFYNKTAATGAYLVEKYSLFSKYKFRG